MNRKLGIWQTEIGFTPSPSWVPNNYPRFFHGALSHDWQPNRYRIFQFAYWSPNDPEAFGFGRCLLKGDLLTHHGRSLVTLVELLDDPAVDAYPHWRTRPILRTQINERKSSVEGFHCGDRIVLAIHLADQNGAGIFTDWNHSLDVLPFEWADTRLDVLLPKLTPAEIAQAWRVGIYGSRVPLEVLPLEGNKPGVHVLVPTMDSDGDEKKSNLAAKMHALYLIVALTKWHDPAWRSRQVWKTARARLRRPPAGPVATTPAPATAGRGPIPCLNRSPKRNSPTTFGNSACATEIRSCCTAR